MWMAVYTMYSIQGIRWLEIDATVQNDVVGAVGSTERRERSLRVDTGEWSVRMALQQVGRCLVTGGGCLVVGGLRGSGYGNENLGVIMVSDW